MFKAEGYLPFALPFFFAADFFGAFFFADAMMASSLELKGGLVP